MWSDLLILSGFAAAGYSLAIYTWPSLRQWLVGIEEEIGKLRNRASDLEARLRRLRGSGR
jgi:hypothetical protein